MKHYILRCRNCYRKDDLYLKVIALSKEQALDIGMKQANDFTSHDPKDWRRSWSRGQCRRVDIVRIAKISDILAEAISNEQFNVLLDTLNKRIDDCRDMRYVL